MGIKELTTFIVIDDVCNKEGQHDIMPPIIVSSRSLFGRTFEIAVIICRRCGMVYHYGWTNGD